MVDWSMMMNYAGMQNFTGMMFGFGIFWSVLFLLLGVFWLWMLIDLLKRKLNDKVAWVLVLVFLNILGAIIYYFLVFSNKKRR